ncbi:MAG: DUF1249 domain-containing protein [Ectothiorhodospiraceae bacterium]
MFTETRQLGLLETVPARTFATLMELYENNYILIRRLAPSLQGMAGEHVSRVSGAVDLHLQVLEQTPYTSALLLTHYFRRAEADTAQPGLQLRVYHDARVCEVLPETDVSHFNLWSGRKPPCKTLEWRWELNRFLNRWLRYCLSEGHAFTTRLAGTG